MYGKIWGASGRPSPAAYMAGPGGENRLLLQVRGFTGSSQLHTYPGGGPAMGGQEGADEHEGEERSGPDPPSAIVANFFAVVALVIYCNQRTARVCLCRIALRWVSLGFVTAVYTLCYAMLCYTDGGRYVRVLVGHCALGTGQSV